MATLRGALSQIQVLSLIAKNHTVYVHARKLQVTVDGWKRYAVSRKTIKAIKTAQDKCPDCPATKATTDCNSCGEVNQGGPSCFGILSAN